MFVNVWCSVDSLIFNVFLEFLLMEYEWSLYYLLLVQ